MLKAPAAQACAGMLSALVRKLEVQGKRPRNQWAVAQAVSEQVWRCPSVVLAARA